MNVQDAMANRVVSVGPDATVAAAARLLAQHNIGALPVCSPDGRLRGMVTDRDIVLRCVAAEEDPNELTVRQIMTRRVICARPEDPTALAAQQMAREQVRRLPVEHNGKLVGMLSLADLTHSATTDMEAAQTLSEICSNLKRK